MAMSMSLKLGQLRQMVSASSCLRHVSTSAVCADKHLRSGQYRITQNQNKPLTYEEANPPYTIGVRKGWNSWNTSNLHNEEDRSSETTIEDLFIRKFMYGTWHNLFASEIIIKRRHNIIVIAGIVTQKINPRKIYFLLGYTEELLSHLFKCPVKVELSSVDSHKDMIFKYI